MIFISTQNFPPDIGGIENLMAGLADAIHASGRQVTVFADGARDAADAARPYPVLRFDGPRPLRRWRKARALRRAALSQPPDGIFADSWKSAELLPDLGVPVAALAHGTEFPQRVGETKRGRIVRALAKTGCVIANSAYTASLVAPCLAESTRLCVVNPPIDPQPRPGAGALAEVRELVAGRGPVLLTLARLEPRKGVDTVIRALPQIRARHPQLVYLVAGEGADRERLAQLALSLGVMDCVRFIGRVDGECKAALLDSADLFLMPARREGDSVEGFGIVYLEAGWYGVPSIAGREGGAVDAVIDGETGLLCNPYDVDDLATGVLRLLDDGVLRDRMGADAAAQARGPSQWAGTLQAYLQALFA